MTTRRRETSAAKAPRKTEAVTYPRTLFAWLKRDVDAFRDGVEARLDVFELAQRLGREPFAVLQHLDTTGLFSCEPGSEEEVEVFSMALSGIPLVEAIRWCAAEPNRLHFAVLDSLRKSEDPKAGLLLAREHDIWGVNAAALDDLRWLAQQPSDAVAAAAAAVRASYEAPTCATLRAQLLSGDRAARSANDWPAPSLQAADGWPSRTSRTSDPSASRQSKRRPRGETKYGPRRRTASRKRGLSPSVSPGAPVVDRRTAAERAWESKTTW